MPYFLYFKIFFVTTFFQVPGFDGFHDVERNAQGGVDLAVLGFGNGGFPDFQYSALCQKRLSKGRFRWWPEGSQATLTLEAHQLQLLLAGGDPAAAKGVAVWRDVQEQR